MFKNPYWFKHCCLTEEQRKAFRKYEKALEEREKSFDLPLSEEGVIVDSLPDVKDVEVVKDVEAQDVEEYDF